MSGKCGNLLDDDEFLAGVDVWADYYRLNKEEGWTQQRIADAKVVHINTVGLRIRLQESLPINARKAVTDGILDEGHAEAVLQVSQTSVILEFWLTTEQAQTELVAEVLGKCKRWNNY